MDISKTNKLPFECIPSLTDDHGYRELDGSLVLQAIEHDDKSVGMIVEATRLGADGRKLTGYSTLKPHELLALWAAFDRLGKKHGFAELVQNEEDFEAERQRTSEIRASGLEKFRKKLAEKGRNSPDEGPLSS